MTGTQLHDDNQLDMARVPRQNVSLNQAGEAVVDIESGA